MQFSTGDELDLAVQFFRGEGFQQDGKATNTGEGVLMMKPQQQQQQRTWAGLSVRNPTLAIKWASSPPDDVQPPAPLLRGASTGADDLVERNVTPPTGGATAATRTTTPEPPKAPITPPRAALEFKKRPVTFKPPPSGPPPKSNLTKELESLKRGGGVIGDATGPQVQITVFLPNRKPLEFRASKTATIWQIIAAVVERAGSKGLGRRGKAEDYELRLHDTDGLPDEDFPSLEMTSLVVEMGSTEFCLCRISGSGDDNGDGVSEASDSTPVEMSGTAAATTPSTLLRGSSMAARAAAAGGAGEGNVRGFVKIRLLEKGEMTSKPVTDELRISTLLASIINGKSRPYPLFADNYQLQVTKADMDRLGLLSQFCDPQALVVSFDVTEFELAPRRFVDSAPMVDAEALTREVEMEARRISATRSRNRQSVDSPIPSDAARKSALGEDGKRPISPRSGFMNMSASKSKKAQKKLAREAVDPESILLNEIKAAVYEQWDVIKFNQWNKAQKRVLGVDLQKIYNKQRDSEEKMSGKVQRDERLIADVLSIEMDKQNPAAFLIRYRDGPGGGEAIRKYEAEDGPHAAAEIVAKVKFLLSSSSFSFQGGVGGGGRSAG